MARLRNSAALLAIGIGLAACAHDDQLAPGNRNPSLSSVNQPVVERLDYVLDLAAGSGGVAPAELKQLDDWFGTLDLDYGDRVYIDQPAGYDDPAVRDDIARVVGRYGMLLSEGAPVLGGEVQPGAVRVVVSTSVASVPGCPIWEEGQIGAPISTPFNYGCATNSNLAAMVADPNDLVLGQDGTDVRDAYETVKAVRMYRNRKLTGYKPLKALRTSGSN